MIIHYKFTSESWDEKLQIAEHTVRLCGRFLDSMANSYCTTCNFIIFMLFMLIYLKLNIGLFKTSFYNQA